MLISTRAAAGVTEHSSIKSAISAWRMVFSRCPTASALDRHSSVRLRAAMILEMNAPAVVPPKRGYRMWVIAGVAVLGVLVAFGVGLYFIVTGILKDTDA